MINYRAGGHHGVTVIREGDGHRCQRADHDCERGHMVAVVTNGDVDLADRIGALLTEGLATLAGATGAELLSELLERGELDDDEDGTTLVARITALQAELDSYTLEARRKDYAKPVDDR